MLPRKFSMKGVVFLFLLHLFFFFLFSSFSLPPSDCEQFLKGVVFPLVVKTHQKHIWLMKKGAVLSGAARSGFLPWVS